MSHLQPGNLRVVEGVILHQFYHVVIQQTERKPDSYVLNLFHTSKSRYQTTTHTNTWNNNNNNNNNYSNYNKGKGKVFPLQARCGPEVG